MLAASASRQYTFSIYWAFTTLTTVGYGDITPTNDAERMYTVGALLVTALISGYIISNIGAPTPIDCNRHPGLGLILA